MNSPRPLSFRTSRRLTSLSLAAIVALGAAACRSGPPRGPNGGPQPIHVPAMEASGKFFDAQLSASVRFGRANFPGGPGRPGGADGGARGEGRGPRGGGGGFSASAGMGPVGVGGGGGGGRGPGGGGPDFDGEGPSASPVGARARTENNPAVQLHLSLTNDGADPLEIEVLEFSSLLGNFAVQPAKVSLAPGQTARFEPMTSRLGIPQGDLPIKVRLRHGDKTDEQTLILKIVPDTAADAP